MWHCFLFLFPEIILFIIPSSEIILVIMAMPVVKSPEMFSGGVESVHFSWAYHPGLSGDCLSKL